MTFAQPKLRPCQAPASALMRADSRDSLRAIVLACTTPLLAARCISGCASRSAACAAALSPPAMVVSTFLMKVRMRDFRAWLRRVRVLVWRMRLRAEAVLAMGQNHSSGGWDRSTADASAPEGRDFYEAASRESSRQ